MLSEAESHFQKPIISSPSQGVKVRLGRGGEGLKMSWVLEDMSPKHFIMYIEEPVFRRQMQQPMGPGQPSVIFQGC